MRTRQPVHAVSVALRILFGMIWMTILTIPFVLITPLFTASRTTRVRIGNLYGKLLGSAVTWLVGARIVGLDRAKLDTAKPAIYIANHASSLDMFLGMWLCPYGGVGIAKQEITKIPVFGLAYKLSGHLLLDRANKERAIASMNALAEIVRKNRLSIWLWPEGTRSRNGELLPFKKGFVHLAIATGLPIVPIVTHNAPQVWPVASFRFSPGDVKVEVLDPIDTSNWSVDDIDSHVAEVRSLYSNALGTP
jgi:lysophosphatidate acyltransferase